MKRGRLLIGILIAIFTVFGYLSLRQENPITGQVQHIALDVDQEVALGLQAAPEMAREMGGLDPDRATQELVSSTGNRIVQRSVAGTTPYRFQFHALADPQTVNAFALPGGPVFVTRGLLSRLTTEGQLAGVLAHEVGHVVGRHTSAQIAKSRLAQGLVTAIGVAGSDEEGRGQNAAYMAAIAAEIVQLRYGRGAETQADTLGVRLMSQAGYDPRSLLEVMRILAEASGPSRGPEFLSSHPDPGNRTEVITAAIQRNFPAGVPANLTRGRRLVIAER